MSTLWFGAISSLGGVLIGAWTTYLIQKANWKRETRRQVYASFAGESRIWLESIQRVKSAIEWNFEPSKREPHWDRANAERAQVYGLRAQIDLLGKDPTRKTAHDLECSIAEINSDMDEYGQGKKPPPDAVKYRKKFDHCLNEFQHAASAELRMGSFKARLRRWVVVAR